MKEKDFEGLTDEELENIIDKGYLMILENPDLVEFTKGVYLCKDDAPYEVKMVVRAKNERIKFMAKLREKNRKNRGN